MSAFSVQQQLSERRKKFNHKKSNNENEEDMDVKMQNNIEIYHNDDDDEDSDDSNDDISYQPQINELQKKIKIKEKYVHQLYNKLNKETVKLNKLQFELEKLQKKKKQKKKRKRYNKNNHNNHNNYHRDPHSMPELIRDEKQRMAKQEENDREVAKLLQAQLDREQNQIQHQHQQQQQRRQQRQQRQQNRDIPFYQHVINDHDDEDDDDWNEFDHDWFIMNRDRNNNDNDNDDNHNNRNHNLNGRDPFNMNSSPFVSAIRGGLFDQSGINAIQRHQMRIHRPLYGHHHHRLMLNGFNGINGIHDIPNIDNMSFDELNNLFPNIPRGANEETIQRLPTDTFQKKQNDDIEENINLNQNKKDKDEKNKCCICLELFKNGEEIRRLPCLHIFHKHEIDRWLRQNRVCPICRINVEQNE